MAANSPRAANVGCLERPLERGTGREHRLQQVGPPGTRPRFPRPPRAPDQSTRSTLRCSRPPVGAPRGSAAPRRRTNRPSLTATVRDRIVGNTRRTSSVVRTNSAPPGGSSSSLSNAFASAFASCGTSRSALPMMNTLAPPSTDVSAARRWSRRTEAREWMAIPSGVFQSPFPRCIHQAGQRFGGLLDLLGRIRRLGAGNGHEPMHVRMWTSTRRQLRHSPQGSRPGRSQRTSCASHRASLCFPTPAGPVTSRTWGRCSDLTAAASFPALVRVADQAL